MIIPMGRAKQKHETKFPSPQNTTKQYFTQYDKSSNCVMPEESKMCPRERRKSPAKSIRRNSPMKGLLYTLV